MIYRSRVHITDDELKYIEDAIENGGMSEDETITKTAKFGNGYEMDIKCCGADDEHAWTEAVLFNSEGSQIAVSEPSDDFFGIWELEDDDGNTYKANVVKVIKRSVDEAKKILESAGYLVERTPLEARTKDRFNVPALSKAPEKIKDRVNNFRAFLNYMYYEGKKTYFRYFVDEAKEIINTALKNYEVVFNQYDTVNGYDADNDCAYIYTDVILAEMDKNGLLKNKSIVEKLNRKFDDLSHKVYREIGVDIVIDSIDIKYQSGNVIASLRVEFNAVKADPNDISASLILLMRSMLIKLIRKTVDSVVMKVDDIINKWEKSYNKAWKNESYRLTEGRGRINLQAFRQSVFDLAVKMGANYDAAYDAANMIDMDMAKESTVEELAKEIAQEYPAR